MILRFDHYSYSFAEPESATAPIATRVENLLRQVIGESHGHRYGYRGHIHRRDGFNDLGFYMNLCAQDGCFKVDICAIHVHHSSLCCMGIQAVYQWMDINGNVLGTLEAPAHVYE